MADMNTAARLVGEPAAIEDGGQLPPACFQLLVEFARAGVKGADRLEHGRGRRLAERRQTRQPQSMETLPLVLVSFEAGQEAPPEGEIRPPPLVLLRRRPRI